MNDNQAVIQCAGLTKTFADGKLYVEVLRGIDFTINEGELVGIVGASGAGKSTLLHLLGGLDKPTEGYVRIGGTDITTLTEVQLSRLRNHSLGFIYQFHHLLPEFDALENVCMPLLIRGLKPKDAEQKGLDLLEKVGLTKRAYHRIGELSGGERQRIAIARALVTEPKCVLADEPTGNLDHHTAQQVIDLMLDLNKSLKTSFIIASHDLNLAKQMDRVVTIADGQISSAR